MAGGGSDGEAMRLTVEGRNCWCRRRSPRFAMLVDAAAYYRAFRLAACRARHSILIVGWSINSRTRLLLDGSDDPDCPDELGPLLTHLASRPDGPEVHILVWDSPLIFGREREWLPQIGFGWLSSPRVHVTLDDQHPIGASQHQKLVVIDDAIAFAGGIDLSIDRLDEPAHLPDDPRRRNADGGAYPPFHDVQAAVDGPAAKALAALARERWRRATGKAPPAVPAGSDPWPPELAFDVADADVAIARTYPPWKGAPAVREVERLFVDSIAAARHTIYIENQYFTATAVAAALRRRLRRRDCPEIVLVLPREPMNWVEGAALAMRQSRLIARLRKRDRFGRLRIYAPVLGERGEIALKVHAKVMAVDDRLLRVGSGNLNNRSMGLDCECDLALEALPGTPAAAAVERLRDRLLAEHLGVPAERLAEARGRHGSLIAAIEALRGPGRSLVPYPDLRPGGVEAALAEWTALDPDAPAAPERMADDLSRDRAERTTLRHGLLRLAALLALLLGLAAAWRWGPLADLVDVATLQAWGGLLREGWVGVAAVLGVYLVGSLVMFPVVVLILATGLLYGPLDGLLIAGAGSLLGALAGYAAGALLGWRLLRRLMRQRVEHIVRKLASHGVLAVTMIRLIPVAPFTLINMAAGAARIRIRDYLLGTAIGMAPGISVMTLFSGQLGVLLREPHWTGIAMLFGLLLVIAGAGLWAWRRIVTGRVDRAAGRRRPPPAAGVPQSPS